MNKTKLLTYSVIALLLLNLATIGFMLPKPGERHRATPREIIIKKLNFDENQQKEYEELISWHRSHIDELDAKIRVTKKELYAQLLVKESNLNTTDSLLTALSDCQKQIETTHFKHFKDIKKLCRKDQLNRFDALTEDLNKLFSDHRPTKLPRD